MHSACCQLRRTPTAFCVARRAEGRGHTVPGARRRRININAPGFTATRLLASPARVGCMFTNTFLNVCAAITTPPAPFPLPSSRHPFVPGGICSRARFIPFDSLSRVHARVRVRTGGGFRRRKCAEQANLDNSLPSMASDARSSQKWLRVGLLPFRGIRTLLRLVADLTGERNR